MDEAKKIEYNMINDVNKPGSDISTYTECLEKMCLIKIQGYKRLLEKVKSF